MDDDRLASENNSGNGNATSHVTLRRCRNLSQQFESCSDKVILDEDHYSVNESSGARTNLKDGKVHQLGDYFWGNHKVITCVNASVANDHKTVDTPGRCVPFVVRGDQYQLESDGTMTLSTSNTNKSFSQVYYSWTVDELGNGWMNVCFKMRVRLLKCRFIEFPPEHMELMPNLNLRTSLYNLPVEYEPGDYMLSADNTWANSCPHADHVAYRRNQTRTESVETATTNIGATVDPTKLRVKCPENFEEILSKHDNPYVMCHPMSCANVVITYSAKKTAGHHNVTITMVSHKCENFTAEFVNCDRKVMLDEYEFSTDRNTGTITNFRDGTEIVVGNYFASGQKVIICADSTTNTTQLMSRKSDTSPTIKIPALCAPYVVPNGRYHIGPDDTLTFNQGDGQNRSFSTIYYMWTADDQGSGWMTLCFEMAARLLTCKPIEFPQEEIEKLPDMSLRTTLYDVDVSYQPGEYKLSLDGTRANACADINHNADLYGRKTQFGILAIVSAFFLFLAILVNLRLGHRHKPTSMLCLQINLFVYYLFETIYFFGAPFRISAFNYAIFVILYVMGLASYFWFNVHSIHLWHSFANITARASFSKGSDRHKKRRRFLLQSCYAWGIPILLCTVLLIINAKEQWQVALGIQLQLGRSAWLHDNLVLVVFMTVPNIVLLIANVVFFLLTIINMRKASRGTEMINRTVNRQMLVVFIKLFVVMGVFWIYNFVVSLLIASIYVQYVVDALNHLHGLLIFLVCACNKTTLRFIKDNILTSEENPR